VAAQYPDLLTKFDAIVKKEHKEPIKDVWKFAADVIKATDKK